MHKYRLISKKGEGTFSEVLKAQSIKNGKYLAIKCMKNHFDSIEQVNNLREIQALRRLSVSTNREGWGDGGGGRENEDKDGWPMIRERNVIELGDRWR